MPFLLLGDQKLRRRIELPLGTYGLIALNVVIFVYAQSLGRANQELFSFGYGFIPGVFDGTTPLPDEIRRLPSWATLLTYQFLHSGWDHLLGNMLFLWVFGDKVEDAMGHLRFLAFYLIGGVLAGLAHYAVDPASLAPLIGASGAISAVLGAYLVLHPFARMLVLVIALPLRIPAWILLLLWFGFQFASLGGEDEGVAWTAHIVGFLAGMLLVFPFRARGVPVFSREGPRGMMVGTPPPRRRAPSAGQGSSHRRGPGEPPSGPSPG